ncbi:MAG: 3'-5' exonuclease [Myxococcota bacterium]|nr:3'-5' exonuclease [Myxococcota bacterium]
MNLTDTQRRVAACTDRTILVLAAVGSGKTTTLSERVAMAVERGIHPARILALTFTNRAAQNMRERLASRDAIAARRVNVHTFHGLCARILRVEARTLGLSPSLWVHDEEDSEALIQSLGVRDARKAMFRLQAELSNEPVGDACLQRYATGEFSREPWAGSYIRALSERGAVDFAGLVYLTRAALTEIPAVAERWSSKFDWIQIDEVQDTHLSEYDVIRHLSARAESLCLVGDLDQTIYGWRGSTPDRLIGRIEADRGDATRITMAENFRSTRALLETANRVAQGLPNRATHVVPAMDLPEGEPTEIAQFETPEEEAIGIANRIGQRIRRGANPSTVAVLCRANWSTALIARALSAHGIPHATIESFRFFRRMEVKDALALLKLVVDRDSPTAAHRVALKLVRGIGKGGLERIRTEGGGAGLRLVDLLDPVIVDRGDPMWGLECEEYVVLDTETTGVNPATDDIIEVAAVRVRCGKMVDSYQALIRTDTPVGDSESVHGLSDALLTAEGRDAATVFREFAAFIGTSPVAGHNVRFDLRMLTSHSARAGAPLVFGPSFDSLRYARRLLRCESYRLGDLAEHLQLPEDPTHRALDDVRTTVHLLARLAPRAEAGRVVRQQLLQRFAPAFERLRDSLTRWAALDERPGVLIHRILNEGGLLAYYRSKLDERRLANLQELSQRVARFDDPALSGIEATRRALDAAALSRDHDAIDEMVGVRVITIHQSKGLEFDHVFVPGMVDGRFPMWSAIEAGDTEEDRRVFYVAVTRAKKTLTLTGYQQDRRGLCAPSRFLDGLGTP